MGSPLLQNPYLHPYLPILALPSQYLLAWAQPCSPAHTFTHIFPSLPSQANTFWHGLTLAPQPIPSPIPSHPCPPQPIPLGIGSPLLPSPYLHPYLSILALPSQYLWAWAHPCSPTTMLLALLLF